MKIEPYQYDRYEHPHHTVGLENLYRLRHLRVIIWGEGESQSTKSVRVRIFLGS